MEYKRFGERYVIRFDKGEEVIGKLFVLTRIEGTVERQFSEKIGLNLFKFV